MAWLKKAAMTGAIYGLAVSLTACSGVTGNMTGGAAGGAAGDTPEREVIEQPDKTITVIEAPPVEEEKVGVESIATIEGARGMDFLTDDTVIISKANQAFKPHSVEGEARYPNNLYVYDLSSKSEEALLEKDENQGFAVLSPDRKHLFYKVNVEDSAYAYIMDLSARESVRVGEEEVSVYGGEWLDNSNVLLSLPIGSLLSSDLTGKTKLVKETELPVLTAAKGEGGIYYVAGEELFFLSDDGSEPEKLADGVSWVIPSPDGKQLALVTRDGTTATLSITDTKGQVQLEIDAATQIFGTSWSPDGTKLVYNLISEDSGNSGVFIADHLTGEKTPITVDFQYASDPLRWSPSGNKIMTSTITQNGPITYVVTLK